MWSHDWLQNQNSYKAVCEIIWIYQLLSEVVLKISIPAKLWCYNQTALHIASNPVFHEQTKHIEIDCHFVREKIQLGLITTRHVKIREQLGDIFTKALNGVRVDYLCNKLGMINIYASAWVELLYIVYRNRKYEDMIYLDCRVWLP